MGIGYGYGYRGRQQSAEIKLMALKTFSTYVFS